MSSTALPEQPQAGNASKLESKSEGELERTTETNGEQSASTDKPENRCMEAVPGDWTSRQACIL